MNNKVAHICTSSYSHKILVDKLAMLQKRGYEIHLISSREGFDHELMKDYDLHLRFISMNRNIRLLHDIVSIIKLMKLFRKEKYKIVHTHTAKAGILGRIAAKMARVPVIIHTTHGLPFYEGQNDSAFKRYRFFEKLGSLFGDAIASQNKEDIEKLRTFIHNKPIYYEGNGVDLNVLDKRKKNITAEELSNLQTNLNIVSTTKVILVAARLEPVKDHAYLLDGLQELKKKRKDFVCILAGQGELEEDIKTKTKELHLEGHVCMIGQQTDIYPYIESADIVTLTSEKEGLPRIIMEAMAFSKPTVATDVLGTRELVVNNETGILVEYKNVDALADAFDKLFGDVDLRLQYGAVGRSMIENEFTEEKVVDRIENMYETLLSE